MSPMSEGPEISLEAVTVLVILLPGFLCARIAQALCVEPDRTEMDKLVEALLYSFLIYTSFIALFGKLELDSKHLAWLAITAVCWGLAISIVWTNDFAGRVLRPMRITRRTSRQSVWIDTFHEHSGYVLVELADGRLVLGWTSFFSEDNRTSEGTSRTALFLEDAAWVTSDGKRQQIDGPGILITEECRITTVSFLNGLKVSSNPADNKGSAHRGPATG
jgi:hypothetical protein